jgi:uncharacterized membrane protein YkvA (DUF1232 family)
MTVWSVPAGVAVAVLACWLALVAALLVTRPRGSLLSEAVRLLPDLLRLLRRLAADRTVPAAVRVRVGLLLAYLAIPIDVVPDFLPVIGYADDAVVTALVLRSVVRRAGIEALRRHWPGSEDGFAAVRALAGVRDGSLDAEPRGAPPRETPTPSSRGRREIRPDDDGTAGV